MIIYGVCRSCQNHLKIQALATSRRELSQERGPVIKLVCTRCGVPNTFEINSLKAKLPKRIRTIGLEIIVIGLIVLLLSVYLLESPKLILLSITLYTLPAALYFWYSRRTFNIVASFNKNKT